MLLGNRGILSWAGLRPATDKTSTLFERTMRAANKINGLGPDHHNPLMDHNGEPRPIGRIELVPLPNGHIRFVVWSEGQSIFSPVAAPRDFDCLLKCTRLLIDSLAGVMSDETRRLLAKYN